MPREMVRNDAVPIRPAATILIIREKAVGLEVLTLKRSAQMRFLPNHLAFPGGRVQASDDETARLRLYGVIQASENANDASFAMAALRETVEETGLFVAVEAENRPGEGACLVASESSQRALLAESVSFQDVLADLKLRVNARALRFVGQWITPEFMPARFDTRFFVTPWSGHDVSLRSHTTENEWLAWRTPQSLLSDIEIGSALAVPPTIAMLKALVLAQNVQSCMAQLHVPGPRSE